MQVSLELLVIEVGVSGQPFQVDYKVYGEWATDSWLKSVWEKVFLFGVVVIEGNLKVELPRQNDEWPMPVLRRLHFSEPELACLNWVRLHQQVLFVLDVMDAGGRALDQKYLNKQTEGDCWSSFRLLTQKVPNKDISLWRNALHQLRHVRTAHLGDFVCWGHKQWEWRFDEG